MPERDWQKDWELCEKAKYTNVQDGNGALIPFMQVPALNAYHMQLMREALEALPYWLQRIRELKTLLDIVLTTCANAGLVTDSFSEADCRKILHDIDEVWREAMAQWGRD